MTGSTLRLSWPGWRHLPRETRDTLFLLVVIGWTVLPHLEHLPWWCGAMTALVMAWRARIALTGAPLPARWQLIAVVVTAAALTWSTEHTLLGKQAGVTLLVMLMVLKTLELRARRDALVVFFLGFFLVLTNFLYSQSIFVAAAMLGSVWGLLTALVLAHMPVGQPSLREAGGLSARAALLGAPVMVALFLLFPRIAPLWGLPADAGVTGLSGSMRMGQVAEVANDDSIAFRIRFDGRTPPPETLYFRGPVLTRFDGVEWQRADSAGLPVGPALRVRGEPVDYEITLEPLRLALLPLLEATPDEPGSAPRAPGWRFAMRGDLQWTADRAIGERLRLKARAWPQFEQGALHGGEALYEARALPPGFNPRTLAWAQALRREPRLAQADARTLAAAVLQHIRQGGFSYTLAPGEYGRDAIDEFWLERRTGFCEHYAAAFVVVMRAMGVPARVVTGYQGTDASPVDGYWAVRQSHAHAWAEYWQPGAGWLRADPTAAVAPQRILRSRNLAPRGGFMAQAVTTVNPALWLQLRGAWEALNNRWNQWVLGYSQQSQFDLLKRLGVRSPSWEDLSLLLIGLLSTGSLAGALWAWWDRHRTDPWQRLQARIRRRLQRLGVSAAAHEAPRGLADGVQRRFGEAGRGLAECLLELERLRYGRAALRRPPPGWWRGFAGEARRLGALAIIDR